MLAGGTSLFRGFEDRLKSEVVSLDSSLANLKLHGERTYRGKSSWIGGSIIANLDSSRKLMITRQAFEEEGERILRNSLF